MALNSKEVYDINCVEIKQEVVTNENNEVRLEQDEKEGSISSFNSMNRCEIKQEVISNESDEVRLKQDDKGFLSSFNKMDSCEIKQEIITNDSDEVKLEQDGKESSLLSFNKIDNYKLLKQNTEELYPGHVVKVEIVIGPEILQLTDSVVTSDTTDTVAGKHEEQVSKVNSDAKVENSYGLPNGLYPIRGQKNSNVTNNTINNEESSRELHTCMYCEKKLSSYTSLREHLQRHTEAPLICSICGAKRRTSETLNAHIARMHNNQCKICTKQCSNKRLLQAHMLTHYEEKTFSCTICPKKFGTSCNLRRHLLLHTEEPQLPCDFCGYKFRNNESLRVHKIRAHAPERPYKCDKCDKCYARINDLKIHQIKHTGEKPFSCTLCPKAFLREKGLKDHCLKNHTKDLADK